MIRVFFLSVVCFSFISSATAQSELDSLRSLYASSITDDEKLDLANLLSRRYTYVDPDSARYFGLEAISLATATENWDALAFGWLNTGVSHHVVGEFDQAISYYQQVYAYRMEVVDSTGISAVLNNLGAVYASVGNYPKSLDALQKSLDIKLALRQLDRSVTTLANIGNIYLDQKSYDQALRYYLRSLDISKELGDSKGSFRASNNIGLAFLQLGYSDSALHYYRQSEVVYDGSNPCEKSFMLDGLAQVYLDKNELDKSTIYAEELLEVSTACSNPEKQSSALTILGKIELQKGNVTKGLKTLEQAAELADQIDQRQNIVDASYALYGAYQSVGQYDKALNYLEIYMAENDSLKNAAMTKELTRVELQFEFNQELDSIAYEQRIAEAAFEQELSQKQKTLYLVLSILLLVAVVAGVLYMYYRNKSRLNKQLTLQNEQIQKAYEEREVLMREIHHRVKNNLQVVSSLLNIQSKLTPHEDAKEALTESRDRVLTMAMIHQKLYRSENLSAISLKDYIEELGSSVLSSHQLSSKEINLQMRIADAHLELDQMINIGLIINELITNSLKHAFSSQEDGEIVVLIHKKDQQLEIEVSDNGIHNPNEKSTNSYGQRLIQSLVAGMNGEISIETHQGTTTRVNFPME